MRKDFHVLASDGCVPFTIPTARTSNQVDARIKFRGDDAKVLFRWLMLKIENLEAVQKGEKTVPVPKVERVEPPPEGETLSDKQLQALIEKLKCVQLVMETEEFASFHGYRTEPSARVTRRKLVAQLSVSS
jgi:hypothetical protein